MRNLLPRSLLLLAMLAAPVRAHVPNLAPSPGVPAAAVPVAELAVPPQEAERYVLVSSAGEHGRSARWRDADGHLRYRESMNLRGQVFEQDARLGAGADGLPATLEVRGFTPQGNAAERFAIEGGTARWKSPLDQGESADPAGRYYVSAGGPFLQLADFFERLYAAPGRRLGLLPGGEARMERLDATRIGTGDAAREIELWAITGFSLSPVPVWMAGDRFFATVSWVSLIPAEHVGEADRLQQIQDEALARRNPAFVERFGKLPGVPVAFEDVKAFDSLAGRWLEGQTVLVEGERIVAAGPAAEVAVPAAARRIPGRGKTLVPGLWDAHMHFGDDASGPMLLALGVTSARDPGADIEPAKARLARIASGQLLAPTIHTSVLIDGAGPLAAQGGVTVDSTEAAVAAVRRAHADGFRAIKFYTSMQPEWLRAGAAEAKRLGLHVHGHVPATMRALDAIDAGYGEITHVNFLAMQAMPDSVVDASNGFARFEGPARHARDIDFDTPPMSDLIARMARERIVSDPTLVVFESMLTVDAGDIAPAYIPFIGTLPPQSERQMRSGGWAPAAGETREGYRRSYRALRELVGRLHAAGVPIVAGTDGSGFELVRELELYVEAGLSPAEALQTATIAPSRLVGAEDRTGSITVGKEADLVLVDGDASADVGALRHTEWVMSDGRLMDAAALREAVGLRGSPRN